MLAEFLRGLEPVARERVFWTPSEMALDVASYLTERPPPTALVSSVRAVVRRRDAVLVFDDERGIPHVLPGGRREGDEPLDVALEREILEETGCPIGGDPRPIGVMHFHHLGPKPDDRYPYPDFLQPIFVVSIIGDPVEPTVDPWVRSLRFVPLAQLGALALGVCERAFLEA